MEKVKGRELNLRKEIKEIYSLELKDRVVHNIRKGITQAINTSYYVPKKYFKETVK